MGDMIRCPKCAMYHYRNDPCPDEECKPSGKIEKKINDGGSAFPSGIAGPEYGDKAGECMEPGMSLRAWLAGTIASGCRAGRYVNAGAYPSETKLWSSEEVARLAIRDADAIIAKLKGK